MTVRVASGGVATVSTYEFSLASNTIQNTNTASNTIQNTNTTSNTNTNMRVGSGGAGRVSSYESKSGTPASKRTLQETVQAMIACMQDSLASV